ncbi:MAG: hypothetical protein RMK45_00630 [Armatimonadota bacterium]|nr:hypothetical protein [Armatimonadota bacterium]
MPKPRSFGACPNRPAFNYQGIVPAVPATREELTSILSGFFFMHRLC